MPKIVDHEERREEVIGAVWRVIARDGLDASTIRSIAKEVGSSAGILAHYFKDKDDILTSALRLSHKRIDERWNRKLAGLKGMAALRELVLDNLPLDEERDLETRLEISYWARSLTRDEVREVQDKEASRLYRRMVGLVAEAQRAGEIGEAETPEEITERLLALIDGFSLHAILHPQRVTRALQTELIGRELDRLRPARR